MPKPLHQKINKRILRLEFAEIAPPAFIPDWDTQVRFNPGVFYESVHHYVCLYIDTYGTVVPIPRQKPFQLMRYWKF